MKIRCDYVTNSSSSSFVLCFKEGDDINSVLKKELEWLPEAAKSLAGNLRELNGEELDNTLLDVAEMIANEHITFGGESFYPNPRSFEARWRKSHPEASYSDFYKSEEYKEEIKRLTDENFKNYKARVYGKTYICSYEDHSDFGAMMEREIVPNLKETVLVINEH